MKKRDKILVIIIIIVGLGFIISGITLYKYASNKSEENSTGSTQEETTQINKETSVELTNEDGSNPHFEISNDIVALSKKAIPDATKINFSSQTEYFVSLKELNEKYKVDISHFNTDSISCNIEETGVLFIYTEGEITRTSRVVCGPPTVISPEDKLSE